MSACQRFYYPFEPIKDRCSSSTRRATETTVSPRANGPNAAPSSSRALRVRDLALRLSRLNGWASHCSLR